MSEITSSPRRTQDGVIGSLISGFERIASKPYLILPPLALDLFLWLGPRLTLATMFKAVAASLLAPASAPPEIAQQVTLAKGLIETIGSQFNLFSALSTFPIGVPSLMAATMPGSSPLGAPQMIPLSDPMRVLLAWLGLTILGLGLAAIYHIGLSRAAAPTAPSGRDLTLWPRLLTMTAAAYLGMGAIALVSLMTASVVALVTPFLATGVAFLGFTLLFWLAVYLVFTPHGLVRYRLGLRLAMRESVRIVRRSFFATVGFLTVVVVLSWLTGIVWDMPTSESWFSLLAVLGHAFVSAMLLVASYIFYVGRREAMVAAERPAPAAEEPAVDRRGARGA